MLPHDIISIFQPNKLLFFEMIQDDNTSKYEYLSIVKNIPFWNVTSPFKDGDVISFYNEPIETIQ